MSTESEKGKRDFSLSGLIESFFADRRKDQGPLALPLLILRNDGPLLFSSYPDLDSKQIHSMCALIAGTWQAARALNQIKPSKGALGTKDYRLSFDTSSSGVYVLPIIFKQEEHLLASVYEGETNPAPMKMQLRKLCLELNSYFERRCQEKSPEKEARMAPLFTDITDDEIDRLFNFTGP